ncbi:MAG: tRNA (adenosine(37)-N6)-dimethylallyltransferase MiaA [Ruminococcaceae bacterium]|nr:tRNA (adenosine(37)-N6)-dimethylallyltransferase MiaA [Oscillospiraceae bacterium]
MIERKLPLLAIVGPTAGGKTSLSIALAKRLGGEIISCDSMQLYRGMDVGTAKPTAEEMEGVPHHMIDIREPDESYSCAEYVTDARAIIQDVTSRGLLPILCGGTGLYLDGVLLGGSFEDTPSDPSIRERLQAIAEQEDGKDVLYDRLCEVDPDSASAIHKNNVKRVIRALEIYECCSTPKSVLDKASRERGLLYDATVIGLRYHSRELLYSRIDQRVDLMLSDGLYDEVVRLKAAGVFERNATAAQAIGYKELLGVLDGTATLAEAVDGLKLATRHYAKRQMTWFSAKPYVSWIYADTEDGQMRPFADILDEAMDIVTSRGLRGESK